MPTSSQNSQASFRERVYADYGEECSSPQALLRFRVPYLGWLIKHCFPTDLECQILDLGCGSGALLCLLREAGYSNCQGIDISPSQIKIAQTLGINVMQADVMKALADFKSASFDVVVALDVIEHLSKEELLCFADEVYRILRSGGRWIIHCPNGDSPFFAAVRYGDWTHEQAFTAVSLNQLIKAAGFDTLACYEDKPIPHGIKSAIRAFLWRVLRKVIQIAWLIETGASGNGIFSRNILAVAYKKKV